MKLFRGIAAAMFLAYATASPVSVMEIVTVIQVASQASSTSPADLPNDTPRDLQPANAPAIHAIITPTTRAWRIPEPIITGDPVSCELVPCTTTTFNFRKPIVNKRCQEKKTQLYCPDSSTILSTTCLDQNHLPDCLYVRPIRNFFEYWPLRTILRLSDH